MARRRSALPPNAPAMGWRPRVLKVLTPGAARLLGSRGGQHTLPCNNMAESGGPFKEIELPGASALPLAIVVARVSIDGPFANDV